MRGPDCIFFFVYLFSYVLPPPCALEKTRTLVRCPIDRIRSGSGEHRFSAAAFAAWLLAGLKLFSIFILVYQDELDLGFHFLEQ